MSNFYFEPYVMTLHQGKNKEAAAMKGARYIINKWMPGNAGGVHVLVTPKMAASLLSIYKTMTKDTKIRVSHQSNIPLLEVLQ